MSNSIDSSFVNFNVSAGNITFISLVGFDTAAMTIIRNSKMRKTKRVETLKKVQNAKLQSLLIDEKRKFL